MSGDEAIAWVNRYKRLVKKKSQDFMVKTPYDMEDFLHDAYEAALRAAKVSSLKGISFSTALRVIQNGGWNNRYSFRESTATK